MQIRIRPKHHKNQSYANFEPEPEGHHRCRCGERQQEKNEPCGLVQARDLATETEKLVDDGLIAPDEEDF